MLGEIIDRYCKDVEQQWLERVQRDVNDKPGVALTQLRDGLPDYLTALVRLLSADTWANDGAENTWAGIAREHGITRVRIGFDITQLVHEFVVLRQVIRDVATAHGGITVETQALLADILDSGVAVAVKAYVEARDFAARRKQAEHIGFLTHELRNPLSNAMLAASHLRRQASSEQLANLEVLDRNHTALRDLIDGVLKMGKVAAGKVESHPADVELGKILEPALEGARAAAGEKGLAFSAHYDPTLHVRVDPQLTLSAVQNVADNATRYTDSGSIEVTVDDHPNDVVIHVRDTGPGVSPEELHTIFEPFERGSSGKPGTGLGLAIARRAIEAQGGSIGAESPGPEGCHFWIQLPK